MRWVVALVLLAGCPDPKPVEREAIPVIKKDPRTGRAVAFWPDEVDAGR